jgi:hypothetical protein
MYASMIQNRPANYNNAAEKLEAPPKWPENMENRGNFSGLPPFLPGNLPPNERKFSAGNEIPSLYQSNPINNNLYIQPPPFPNQVPNYNAAIPPKTPPPNFRTILCRNENIEKPSDCFDNSFVCNNDHNICNACRLLNQTQCIHCGRYYSENEIEMLKVFQIS